MRIGGSVSSITFLWLTLLGASGSSLLAQTGRSWVDPPDALTEPSETPAPNQAPAPAPPPAAVDLKPAAPPPAETAKPAKPAEPATETAQPAKPDPAPAAPPARQTAEPPEKTVPRQAAPPAVASNPRDPEEEKLAARTQAAKDFVISYLDSWSASNDEALKATAEFYAPRVLYHGRTVSMKRLHGDKQRFARRWPVREYRPRQDAMGVVCNPPGDVCTVHTVFDYTASNPRRGRMSQGTGALQLIVHFIGDKPVIVAEHSTLISQERRRNLALEGRRND